MLLTFFVFAAALFVDGATDCANCVTGAVTSKTMSLKSSVVINAVLSFFGCLTFSLFFPAVAKNTSSAVTIPTEHTAAAVISALLSVAIWSGFAWLLGLPTSEGHGILAATAGAAFSLGGEISFERLLLIFICVFPASAAGAVLSLIWKKILNNIKDKNCKVPIVLSALLSSFFHGAQDGQKFLALALSASLINEKNKVYVILLFSAFMASGAFFGKRIIKKMGDEMTEADSKATLSSDLGSVCALTAFTVLGIPASTTHIKITSLAFCSKIFKDPKKRELFFLTAATWIATFPICFFLGFFISKLTIVINL